MWARKIHWRRSQLYVAAEGWGLSGPAVQTFNSLIFIWVWFECSLDVVPSVPLILMATHSLGSWLLHHLRHAFWEDLPSSGHLKVMPCSPGRGIVMLFRKTAQLSRVWDLHTPQSKSCFLFYWIQTAGKLEIISISVAESGFITQNAEAWRGRVSLLAPHASCARQQGKPCPYSSPVRIITLQGLCRAQGKQKDPWFTSGLLLYAQHSFWSVSFSGLFYP